MLLEEKIINYVRETFVQIPDDARTEELKDELTSNLIEKARDLLREGKSEEEAYQTAVANMGDLSELTGIMQTDAPQLSPRQKKRYSVATCFCIFLYIISPFAMIWCIVDYNQVGLGLFLMFLLVGIATGILVYIALMRPHTMKSGRQLLAEFKKFGKQFQVN